MVRIRLKRELDREAITTSRKYFFLVVVSRRKKQIRFCMPSVTENS